MLIRTAQMPPAKRKEGAGRRQETRAHQNAESRKIGNTEGAENAEQWLEKMATDFRLSALCALCVSKAILQKAKKWGRTMEGRMIEEFKSMILHRSAPNRSAKLWLF